MLWPTVSRHSVPNVEVQVPVFISPWNRVAQLCSQALGCLFVASYDLQGYGGGIQTRLHAGLFRNGSWSCLDTDCTDDVSTIIACPLVAGETFPQSCSLVVYYRLYTLLFIWLHSSCFEQICHIIYNSECFLHFTTKGKGGVLWPNPTIISSCVSLYAYPHIHTHIFRASVNHHFSVSSYAILLQSSVRPWTQDLLQGYRWVKWASAMNQGT
jgi:hypothetical protein